MKKILLIAIAFIAFFTLLAGCKCKCLSEFKRSETEMLQSVLGNNHFVTPTKLKEMNPEEFILVDLRPGVVFAEGALEGAVNIPSSELLVHDNFEILKHSEKPIVLYAADAASANGAWFMLTQLELPDVKVLSTGYDAFSSEAAASIESARYDFASVFTEASEALKKEMETPKPVVIPQAAAPKKIVPVKKKEVVEEEGC